MDNTNPDTAGVPAPDDGTEPEATLADGAGQIIMPPARTRYGMQPHDRPIDHQAIPYVTRGGFYAQDYPGETPQPAPRSGARGDKRGLGTGIVVLVGLLAGIAGAALTAIALSGSDAFRASATTVPAPRVVTTVVAPPASAAPLPIQTQIIEPSGDITTAAAVGLKVVPSIVTVEIGTTGATGDFEIVASGSGVVLTNDGRIVTNHHVIEGADETQVVFQDGRIYEAIVVGSDPVTDIAVLQIEGESLIGADLGSADSLVIGDTAIAVGNPLGLAGGASLTVGVVSALDREVVVADSANGVLYGMLQTDAPITRGSSGGALVDGTGRLIGITTAIGVSDAGAEGIGFAIPVELMTRVVNEIVATGEVRHAFLGVFLEDVFVSDGSLQTPAGAGIVDIVADTAAEAAGLAEGDQIIGFADKPVTTKEDIIIKLRRFRVGEPVTFVVIRDGVTLEFDVILGERPEDS